MGLGLKSLLFVDESEQKPKESTEVKKTFQQTSKQESFVKKEAPITRESSYVNVSSAQSDSEIVDKLYQFILNNNLPGPDYLELKQHASTLSKHIKDESQQYSAAFDILKGVYPDLTKAKITNAIDEYVSMLEAERKRTLKKCEDEYAEMDVRSKITESQMKANELEKQIKSLQKELDKVNISIEEYQKQSDSAKKVYEDKCATFNACVDEVVGTLREDKEKIEKLDL